MTSLPRICHDVIIPEDLRPKQFGRKPVATESHAPRRRLAVDPERTWPPGTMLRCRFLQGDDATCNKVAAIAREWCRHANLRFEFCQSGPAEIRIAFVPGGSWSAVGTDARNEAYFPRHQPTMNFGWLTSSLPERQWKSVVLHEFGHALGCVHEHQSPKFDRQWNHAEVLHQFSGPPNYWTPEQIARNVFNRYLAEVKATVFDPDSIMLYMFDGSLFSDGGGGTQENCELSGLDIEMIKQMYPFDKY